MAKVKFSAFVSEIRNKENGSVFSKNRYGNYIRNKVTPVNPQTSFQQAVRQRLGNLSSQFRALTAAQIASWVAAAQSFPFTDIFGDQKFLAANALFVKLNSNLQMANQAAVTTAPVPVGIPSITLEGARVEQELGILSMVSLTFAQTTVPVGFALAIYATPVLPQSIQFVKNRTRFLGMFSLSGGEANLTASYIARFGNVGVLGQHVVFRAALISTNSGQQGVPVSLDALVTAEA